MKQRCHSPLSFFGLKPTDKPKIHEAIFTLCYFNHGFNFDEVYTMPIFLRNFYMQLLNKTKQEEKRQQENAQSGRQSDNNESPNIHRPPSFNKE